MSRIDPFTRRRLEKFVTDFREHSGVLPTLSDLAKAGFDKQKVDSAIKDQILVEFYVTLTSGTVLKGYKLHVE
jgi:hypothetical protein